MTGPLECCNVIYWLIRPYNDRKGVEGGQADELIRTNFYLSIQYARNLNTVYFRYQMLHKYS